MQEGWGAGGARAFSAAAWLRSARARPQQARPMSVESQPCRCMCGAPAGARAPGKRDGATWRRAAACSGAACGGAARVETVDGAALVGASADDMRCAFSGRGR